MGPGIHVAGHAEVSLVVDRREEVVAPVAASQPISGRDEVC
jgi:hypothetical protein